MTPAAARPLTFSALLKGECFRIIADDGSVRETVFAKVAKGICKGAEGDWFDIKPATRVQLVATEG